MRSHHALFVLHLFYFYMTAAAHAVPRPSVKKWQEDEFKIGELSMEKFFEKRRGMEKCRETLGKRKEAFEDKKTKLAELQKSLAGKALTAGDKERLKTAEKAVVDARAPYLRMLDLGGKEKDPSTEEMKPVEICGDCHVPEMKAIVVDEDEEGNALEEKETWFVSHGYCSGEGIDEKDFLAAMPKFIEFLRTPPSLEKKNGGFRHVLTHSVIDDAKKEVVKDPPLQKGDTFYTFMGVRADILGAAFATFSYYIKNDVKEASTDNIEKRMLDLTFGVAPRGALVPPKVEDVDVEGNVTKPAMAKDLTAVIGWWHANARKGTRRFRYSTAAKLPKELAALAGAMVGEGRRTHLETVATGMDRFYPKANKKVSREFDERDWEWVGFEERGEVGE